jgi:exonuclease VII large subunit
VFKRAEQTVLHSLSRIESGIIRMKEILMQSEKDLTRDFGLIFAKAIDFIKQSEKSILQGDPQRQLSRGYSIVRHNGKILRSVKSVKNGDKIDVSVLDGIIKAITQ